MKIEGIKKVMQERWEKTDNYDEVKAHNVRNSKEKEYWSKIIKKHLGNERKKVLDLGAGTGFLTIILAELGYSVTALDWSRTMLKKAQTKAEAKRLLINFMQGDAGRLPFLSNQFNMITARHLLWTLVDPKEAITEWMRVLKPDGYLLADISQGVSKHKSQHYSCEIENKLPLNKNVNMEQVTNLFQQVGLVRVASQKISCDNNNNRIDHLIIGCKPSS